MCDAEEEEAGGSGGKAGDDVKEERAVRPRFAIALADTDVDAGTGAIDR